MAALTFWIAHHDVNVPGYEEQGRFAPHEIPGIDVVVNGHIHRQLQDVQIGQTLWVTPGNISRIARSDATKLHTPAVLQVLVTAEGFQRQMVTVPHEPFVGVIINWAARHAKGEWVKRITPHLPRVPATPP